MRWKRSPWRPWRLPRRSLLAALFFFSLSSSFLYFVYVAPGIGKGRAARLGKKKRLSRLRVGEGGAARLGGRRASPLGLACEKEGERERERRATEGGGLFEGRWGGAISARVRPPRARGWRGGEESNGSAGKGRVLSAA